MSLPGKNAAFEFVRSYASRFSNSRMYQTIRVIRPQPQQPTPGFPFKKINFLDQIVSLAFTEFFYLRPDNLENKSCQIQHTS